MSSWIVVLPRVRLLVEMANVARVSSNSLRSFLIDGDERFIVRDAQNSYRSLRTLVESEWGNSPQHGGTTMKEERFENGSELRWGTARVR